MASCQAAQAVSLCAGRDKLQDKPFVNGFRVPLRSDEFHLRLRKAESAHLAKRQGRKADFALPIGKTVTLYFQNVVLRKKKGSDALGGNAPGLTDLHIGHLKSDTIITEERDFAKHKNLHAVSCYFVLFGTRSCSEN
jgi:hypothetical protein